MSQSAPSKGAALVMGAIATICIAILAGMVAAKDNPTPAPAPTVTATLTSVPPTRTATP